MLKITPVKSFLSKNNIYNKSKKIIQQTNNKNLLQASLVALSILGAIAINSCSKIDKLQKENINQEDTTQVNNNSDVNFIIDDSLNVVDHYICL